MTLQYRSLRTDQLGHLHAAADDHGVVALSFTKAGLENHLWRYPDEDGSAGKRADRHLDKLARELDVFGQGRKTRFDVSVRLPDSFPLFFKDVLEACRRIPWGEVMSYGELAAASGRPRAARAVGQAMNRNPLPLIIPCHRVIGSGWRLGGFGPGPDFKKRLLALEGHQVRKGVLVPKSR